MVSSIREDLGEDAVRTGCQIVGGKFADGKWQLSTSRGLFRSPRLIVAQSPWEASRWLDAGLQPTPFKVTALKTQPVSLLVL